MKTRNLLLLFATTLLGLSLNAHAVTDETKTAAKTMGAEKVSEITFDEGKSVLNETARSEIKSAVESAKKEGKIDEISLAVWADREYPSADTKAPKADIKLANDRAKEIKKFIENELKVSNVKTFNMAERPNSLQSLLGTPTAEMKETMESSGAAPKTDKETGLLNQKAQASKAVIMINMKR